MKKRTLLAAAVAGLSVVAGATALPADAASSSVVLTSVKFDSDGKDTPATKAKLNDEYVALKNTSDQDIAISGWTLTDKAGHRYTFAKKTVIEAGEWMRVHTGPGTDTPHHKYWGKNWYVWNNDTDIAWLKNKAGVQRDTCAWTTEDKGNSKTC